MILRRNVFSTATAGLPLSTANRRDPDVLRYLDRLTFSFSRDGDDVSAVLIYAEPDLDNPGQYRAIAAADTGFEGIACIDDTARAALLALAEYERSGSIRALGLARRWLTFVNYMQYPDGSFANFIRNTAGVRNASSPTSRRGGVWWSSRALWALARAYRVTGQKRYLQSFNACKIDPLPDGKINAILALAEMEIYRTSPSPVLAASIADRCELIIGSDRAPYFLDHPATRVVSLWGYHQLHAVASAAQMLDRPSWLRSCRKTVQNLVEPDLANKFWYNFPRRRKRGVCAYAVTPFVQGLAAMYRATGAKRYRTMALSASEWFYGRNDAGMAMYDPETGMCRDGMQYGIASNNYGAESAIEAGIAELERVVLLADR